MCCIPECSLPVTIKEPLGRTRIVYRTSRGILKYCEDEAAAELEARSLRHTARFVGEKIRVPELFCHESTWLLIEDVGSGTPTSEQHWVDAAEYLARLHSVKVSGSVLRTLKKGHHRHYWNRYLESRLRQECEFAKKAKFPAESVSEFCQNVESVVGSVLPGEGDVLGHGDYQKFNLVVSEGGEVCAVDWKDFGLCNRWYDLAHYLHSVPEEHCEAAKVAYREVSRPKCREWDRGLRYGCAVNRIIQAGTAARLVESDHDACLRDFREQLGLLEKAVLLLET